MPRRPLVAANWKMHKTVGEAVDYAGAIVPRVRGAAGVDVVLAPPFPALPALVDALARLGAGDRIAVAAQNMHAEAQGAFTGEVGPPMLRACGVRFVIIGHSERRQLFGETDAGVNAKARAAAAAGLTPIVCVGETLAEREAGSAEAVGRLVQDAHAHLEVDVFRGGQPHYPYLASVE